MILRVARQTIDKMAADESRPASDKYLFHSLYIGRRSASLTDRWRRQPVAVELDGY